MHRIQNTIICTQYAHTQDTETHTHKQNNMQYTEQHTEQNTETHTNTEQRTEQNAQPQRTEHSTYDLHKYSFDLYHEYVSIKNSNTIELYTISKENI